MQEASTSSASPYDSASSFFCPHHPLRKREQGKWALELANLRPNSGSKAPFLARPCAFLCKIGHASCVLSWRKERGNMADFPRTLRATCLRNVTLFAPRLSIPSLHPLSSLSALSQMISFSFIASTCDPKYGPAHSKGTHLGYSAKNGTVILEATQCHQLNIGAA